MRVEAFPGFTPRLVGEVEERPPVHTGPALIEAVRAAGLRGRGGAAFPLATKLEAVASRPGPRHLVVNGEEGEPASVKDRWLLRHRPGLVLDGAELAAHAIGAAHIHLYVSDAAAAASLERELAGRAAPMTVFRVDPAYVAGEETAAVRAIDGGPAKPTDKPPRPFEHGVGGRPTLVANVETLANLPFIAAHGAGAYRTLGTEDSPGTFLMTLSGAVEPRLVEVPFGVTLRDLVGHGESFLMGGFFCGLLGPAALDVPLTYDALRAAGSGLGCGAVIVLDGCPVAAAVDVMAYFARENADQCGACIRGTAAMRDVVLALAHGTVSEAELERLRGWSTSLRGRGACALPDGAAQLAATLLREFEPEVVRHLRGDCAGCAGLALGDDTQFRVELIRTSVLDPK